MESELAAALAAVDDAIAAAPARNGEAFFRALTSLSAYRDKLFARDGRNGEAARHRLNQLNGIISIVLSGHFPLGEPAWDDIRKMRGWLQDLADSAPADADGARAAEVSG